MQKRPSSRSGGTARVDGILRYRSANEGILCSARCRELSRTGLTATIERPVFPGDLLRFDIEPAGGGRSVMGLARVAWTGSDPEGPAGTQLMRIRFLSLGDNSEHALLEWLDELSDVSDRPSSPLDDSSVRALGRAIADSLLPPPPVLPGAAQPSAQPNANTSSSGLTPTPVAVPHRPSIPPPPGLYTRSSRDLTHSVENVGQLATRIAPPLPPPSTPPPAPGKRVATRPPPQPPAQQPAASLFPHPPSLFQPEAPTVPAMPVVSVPPIAPVSVRPTLITPAPAAPLITPPGAPLAKGQRRSADVRERLSRLQRRTDNTPLSMPVDEKLLLLRDDAPPALLAAAPSITLSGYPPLPLGALLNAPPETTRRSSPPPVNVPPPPAGATSSSSWPALRVPPAVAALIHDEPLDRPSRDTIPPPAEISEMPPLRVATPALEDDADGVALPSHAEHVPPQSDAPWSMPALPAHATPPRPWLAICLGSLAAGAGLAYLVYGPSLLQRGDEPSASVAAPVAAAAAAAALPQDDDTLARLLVVPSEQSAAAVLNAPEAPGAGLTAKPGAPSPAVQAVALGPKPQAALPRSALLAAPAALPATPAARPATPAAAVVPVAVPALKEIEPGDKLPPPAPELPVALSGAAETASALAAQPAAGSRIDRARDCLARGDIACATELLQNAGTEPELELWIETLRAQGDGLEARRAMKRFLETYPDGRRATIYRRILNNANAQ
jgi:hypothetical protein